ncbi:hypothetical protein ODY89_19790, partial [Shewanella xiamenensis]|uniref:hypothetical protein n=1 Tax=Shewanella xiamenensis TaxID=332186 RepID=UPI0024A62953
QPPLFALSLNIKAIYPQRHGAAHLKRLYFNLMLFLKDLENRIVHLKSISYNSKGGRVPS